MSDKKFFVHEKALCESTSVGEGTRVWAFSHILPEAKVGKGCNIGEHVFIENRVSIGEGCTIKNGVAIWDCVTLEDDVFVGPYVVFTNDYRPRSFIKKGLQGYLPTLVKKGATLGANATIICGTVIGEYAMVGAGAVVKSNVDANTLVVGNPAKVVGRVCYCGERLHINDFCPRCQKRLKDIQITDLK